MLATAVGFISNNTKRIVGRKVAQHQNAVDDKLVLFEIQYKLNQLKVVVPVNHQQCHCE